MRVQLWMTSLCGSSCMHPYALSYPMLGFTDVHLAAGAGGGEVSRPHFPCLHRCPATENL